MTITLTQCCLVFALAILLITGLVHGMSQESESSQVLCGHEFFNSLVDECGRGYSSSPGHIIMSRLLGDSRNNDNAGMNY